jgi:hypothetical protein
MTTDPIARKRRQQGLPPKVTDPVGLELMAELVIEHDRAMAAKRKREEQLRADSTRGLDEAIAAGRLPAKPSAETLGLIARILKQHYAEQVAAGHYITQRDAAKRAGTSQKRLVEQIKAGDGPRPRLVAGEIWFDPDDVDQWAEQQLWDAAREAMIASRTAQGLPIVLPDDEVATAAELLRPK